MNRKNVIQTLFYVLAAVIVVGLLTWQHETNTRLEETLHENEKTLSETQTSLEQTKKELKSTSYIVEDVKTANTELTAKLSEATQNSEKLSTQVSELTQANSKLQAANKQLQEDYNTLKKNKAIAAEKAKKLSSSQSASTEAGKNTEYVSVSRSNNQTATKTFYVEATAYTAYCAGCSGKTRTGINLRANPDIKVVAVDPRIIPLGSRVWVEGYGYAVAGDTGGAIKGNKVDLFMSSKSAAKQWGRKKVQLKVLK